MRTAGYCDNANGVKLTLSILKAARVTRGCKAQATTNPRELDAEGGASEREQALVALLSDVNFLFLVDTLDKEDERAQESNYGAPDSQP